MNNYRIGETLPLRDGDTLIGSMQIVAVRPNEVEARIIEFRREYSGPLKIGTKLTISDDGYIGTFENPG